MSAPAPTMWSSISQAEYLARECPIVRRTRSWGDLGSVISRSLSGASSIMSKARLTKERAPSPRKSNFARQRASRSSLSNWMNRPTQRRCFDRHVVAKRRGREHEPPTCVERRRGTPRTPPSRARVLSRVDCRNRCRAWDREFPRCTWRLRSDRSSGFSGDVVRHLYRVAERAHRVADGVRPRYICTMHVIAAWAGCISHRHSRALPRGGRVDVDVDVGASVWSIDADLGEETLEQQSMPHRIHRRDGRGVRHRRSSRHAASWQRCIPLAKCTASHITRKNPAKPKLPMTRQLVIQLCSSASRRPRPTARARLETSRAEKCRRVAGGHGNLGSGRLTQARLKSHSAAIRSLSSSPLAPLPARAIFLREARRHSPFDAAAARECVVDGRVGNAAR